MTDQDMDARLRAAGERFRNAHDDTPTTVDVVDVSAGRGRRRAHALLAVAAAAVVLLVAGLALGLRGTHRAVPPSADNAGLVGNVWLVSPDGKPSTAALYISRSGVLVADDECRLIGGKAVVSSKRITVTDLSVRLKPCTDQYGAGFYDRGTRVLRGTSTFRVDSRGMTITHTGIGSLRFALAQTPIPPPTLDVPTLTGTDWVAPDGSVLHIDPTTGQLSGGYCNGRAVVLGALVHFIGCSVTGRVTYGSTISGASLSLQPLHDLGTPPPKRLFRWRPAHDSIVDPASLTSRNWHLQSVAGARASSGSLRIVAGTALIDDGCSTYRRAVTVGAGTLVISGGAPAHPCSGRASTADSFVFADPATWTVRDGKLIVYGGGSQIFALVYGTAASTRTGQDPTLLRAHAWQAPGPDPAVVTFTRTGYTIAHTCYVRTGSATVDADTIVFGQGRSIQHSCPAPPIGSTRDAAARSIDATLSGEVHWSVVNGRLTLSGSPGTLLLRPAGADLTSLTSGAWQLASTTFDGQTRTAVGDVELAFPTPQSLLVKRCYQSSAPVTVRKRTLTVRFLRTSLARPCPYGPPGTQEQNAAIDSVLNGTVSWAVDGDRLTLGRGDGTLLFTRRP